MDLLDYIASKAARDAGIAQVVQSHRTWVDDALALLQPLQGSGKRMTGEDIRIWLLEMGLAEPKRPHAWGALTNTACKRGLLRDTGTQQRMRLARSHARRTPVWEFA